MSGAKRPSTFTISVDKVLGLTGGALAGSSVAFGVYMNIHGPVASFGHSGQFTVFAQLTSQRVLSGSPQVASAPSKANPALDATATGSVAGPSMQALDMTSTGSIAPAPHQTVKSADPATHIIASMSLEAASTGGAVIVVDGHVKSIHVGDRLPDGAEVLEISPGPRAMVRTTRGLILARSGP